MHIVANVARSTVVVVAALFPIVNPLGSALIFLSLTRSFPANLRRILVLKVSLYSLILLVVSILIGSHVLHFFGVSIPVVQVAGGLIVSATGWKLLLQQDVDMKSQKVDPAVAMQQAFYPLTLPITVGPGSISVAITLGADSARTIFAELPLLIAALIGPFIVALSIYICYRSADRLEKILGPTGLGIFLRLSAFIVICIGVQILWNGAAALIHSL